MYVSNHLTCYQETDRRFITGPCCDFRVPRSGYVLSVDHCPDTELQFSTPTPRDLPNVGERETGKADGDIEFRQSTPFTHGIFRFRNTSTAGDCQKMSTTTVVPVGADAPTSTPTNEPVVPQGWTASWHQMISEKWRWGVLIALGG